MNTVATLSNTFRAPTGTGTLCGVVRTVLAAMHADGSLAMRTSIFPLAVAVWTRIARARLGARCSINQVQQALIGLVQTGELSFIQGASSQ